ncbi:MAG TPA: N-formylglutamate amidohydrolase [Methylococcaceae bacterium]|nr:N-formylglutamate amidohydrolase [Methylococcaceae bacterium]
MAEILIDYLLVSCEHGGNRIPLPYRYLFHTDQDQVLLDSHRGFDPGALIMARELATKLTAPLVASTISRLLIDLNRSVGHPHLYSKATRDAPAEVRQQILENYYRPYRSKVENLVRLAVANGSRVIHVSCHSFTPELNGQTRNTDIGLLYHPARTGEAALCERWKASVKACAPELKVRRNYPYAGKNDGLTSYFRQCFPPDAYIGIELEVNQKHVTKAGRSWAAMRTTLIESLRMTLGL